jgi:CobB/CobQ-like glutamine amidotransferase domain
VIPGGRSEGTGGKSTESTIRIGLVLPDVMGTYGDGGNAVVLAQRLRLRGIEADLVDITLDDPVPDSLDLYTLGGAEDYAQRLATKHLIRYPGLQRAAERGAPVLAICAAIQVLGHWYETSAGERVDGVGLLDVTTSPQPGRTIGEVVSQPVVAGLTQRLTGFENHRGGTILARRRNRWPRSSRARAIAKATASTAPSKAAWSPLTCTAPVWPAIRNWLTTYCPVPLASSRRWSCTRSSSCAANA